MRDDVYSIYHFYQHLAQYRNQLVAVSKLEEFPFDTKMIACRSRGQFPDLILKTNTAPCLFAGGEIVELKDSQSYAVASFNSTIPTGQKCIDDIVREVFYLIRGRRPKDGKLKVVLVHGSFFETVKAMHLVSHAFEQVLNERLENRGEHLTPEVKDLLVKIFSEQDSFSKVRSIEKASVNLRFRVMTETNREGNILNSAMYPDILDNTINLVVPAHSPDEEKLNQERFQSAFVSDHNEFTTLSLKHPLNGYFTVFQRNIAK